MLNKKKMKIKEPNKTGKLSSKIITFTIGLIVSLFGSIATFHKISKKGQVENIATQIENLDEISNDLKNVQTFVESQKKKLASENEALENLQKEQKNLKPLVEADKQILEAMFLEQEKRQQKEVWYERAFGFFIGIFSSLIASLLFMWIDRKRKSKIIKDF